VTVATVSALLPVDNGDVTAALRGFLARLLQSGVVEALLTPLETPAGFVTPALVTDPALLDRAAPLAPVMGLNAAPLAGQVSRRAAATVGAESGAPAAGASAGEVGRGSDGARTGSQRRVGVVLRPCELRALTELAKLQQANLADLLTIGIDCPGTCDVPAYGRLGAAGPVDALPWLAAAQRGEPPAGDLLRDACAMCERPQVEASEVRIELFGADLAAGVPLWMPEDVALLLKLPPYDRSSDISRSRAETVGRLVAARTAARDTRLAEIAGRFSSEGIEGVLAACVRCHNCMIACPLCYCRTCLFRSPTFEVEAPQLLARAGRKGALRLPPDTLLFHLTRLNHMALSCVGCGMCTAACPAELPVGRVFRAVGARLQAAFEYQPGRSVDEPLPLVTFREDEWSDVGEG
jgi:formate dehydrogenase (coenzyme F420) beta subunit